MKQILTNIVKTVILSGFLAGAFSCNEDKGNYEYENINSVTIKKIDDLTYSTGETLRISPQLTFSQGENEADFSFTWYYLVSKDPQIWEVLYEGRNLEIEVAYPIGKPDVTYSIIYEVVNKKTQIPYKVKFNLKVISPLTRGFAAICEHDNGFDIDMIALSSDKKFDLYKNVFEMTGSELQREGVKPYDIVTYTDPLAPNPFAIDGKYSFFILTDKYTTRINPSDYSWNSSYDISNIIEKNSYLDREYVRKGEPVVAQKMRFAYYSTGGTSYPRMLMYHKEPDGRGNWYLHNTYMMLSLFSVQMNTVRPNGDPRYEPAPHVFISNEGAMYFDADKKAFMYGRILATSFYSADLFYTEPLPEETTTLFKFSDPNEGLLDMGEVTASSGVSSTGYAILKQVDGSFKYIEFRGASTVAVLANTVANKLRVSNIPASSNIGNAKFIVRAPIDTNSPFLYYVTNDNRVYKADISAATAVVGDITSSVLTNDGYNEITLFKFTLPESNNCEEVVKRALAVGTYNSSLGKANGGKLDFLRISSTASGDLALIQYPESPMPDGYQISMTWKGMGKIVGLTYKTR